MRFVFLRHIISKSRSRNINPWFRKKNKIFLNDLPHIFPHTNFTNGVFLMIFITFFSCLINQLYQDGVSLWKRIRTGVSTSMVSEEILLEYYNYNYWTALQSPTTGSSDVVAVTYCLELDVFGPGYWLYASCELRLHSVVIRVLMNYFYRPVTLAITSLTYLVSKY